MKMMIPKIYQIHRVNLSQLQRMNPVNLSNQIELYLINKIELIRSIIPCFCF